LVIIVGVVRELVELLQLWQPAKEPVEEVEIYFKENTQE